MDLSLSAYTFLKFHISKIAQKKMHSCHTQSQKIIGSSRGSRLIGLRSLVPGSNARFQRGVARHASGEERRHGSLTWNVLGKMAVMNQMFWLVRLCHIYIHSYV
jgi:predicted alpha/beta hydrolase